MVVSLLFSGLSRRYLVLATSTCARMSTQSDSGQYSAAYVTCPNVETAKSLARCVVFCSVCGRFANVQFTSVLLGRFVNI